MYTLSLFRKALVVLLFASSGAFAQNLLINPTFDVSIDNWDISGAADWEPSFGFDNGSLHLSSRVSTSTATQCVLGGYGYTYVASARVDSHCAGARVLYVLWASSEDCSDTADFSHSAFATSANAFDWELLSVIATAPKDAHFVQFRLFNANTCADDVYFDDVSLQFDDIFDDGFDGFGIDDAG